VSFLRALFAALAFTLGAGEAGAHASLVSAVPQDGALLTAPPHEVVLRFDGAVSATVIRLVDDTGASVPLPAAARTEGATVRVALPPQMREGSYLFSYRVTSADSHPIGGAIGFSIGRMSSPVRAESAGIAAQGGWRIAVRAGRDAALLIAAGCALFLLVVAPFPGERRVLVLAGSVAAAFSMLGVGLQGAALTGNEELLALEPWRVALHTSYGSSAIAGAAASLVIALGGVAARGALRTALLAIGTLAAAASVPLTGHAAASPAVLARFSVGAHALAAAFWAGSLIALYVLVTRRSGEAAQVLRRFSRIAMVAVATLLAAGAAFAILQLGSLADLVDTRYGNLIAAKSVLAAALVALAARNRYVLLPALENAASGAPSTLRRAIAAELMLIAVVVGLTAVLVQTPPRTTFIEKQLAAGSRSAILTVTPGLPGSNEIRVLFRDAGGHAYDPAEAALEISNAGAGVEVITRRLLRAGPGSYRYRGGELAFPGSWRVSVRARISDFESADMAATLDIR
jgi:copper transport protein